MQRKKERREWSSWLMHHLASIHMSITLSQQASFDHYFLSKKQQTNNKTQHRQGTQEEFADDQKEHRDVLSILSIPALLITQSILRSLCLKWMNKTEKSRQKTQPKNTNTNNTTTPTPTNNKQQTTNNKQQTTNNKQPNQRNPTNTTNMTSFMSKDNDKNWQRIYKKIRTKLTDFRFQCQPKLQHVPSCCCCCCCCCCYTQKERKREKTKKESKKEKESILQLLSLLRLTKKIQQMK